MEHQKLWIRLRRINGTWDIVRLPKQKKAVRCKWIFKRKKGLSPNKPPRFKARLVAKGFN
jgi:hypothetical protein